MSDRKGMASPDLKELEDEILNQFDTPLTAEETQANMEEESKVDVV